MLTSLDKTTSYSQGRIIIIIIIIIIQLPLLKCYTFVSSSVLTTYCSHLWTPRFRCSCQITPESNLSFASPWGNFVNSVVVNNQRTNIRPARHTPQPKKRRICFINYWPVGSGGMVSTLNTTIKTTSPKNTWMFLRQSLGQKGVPGKTPRQTLKSVQNKKS